MQLLQTLQEPGTMDSVRSGPFGQIFRPDNFIFGQVSFFLPSQSPPGSLLAFSWNERI